MAVNIGEALGCPLPSESLWAGVVWCEAPNIMEIVLIDITNIGEICPDCEGTGAGRGGDGLKEAPQGVT